MIAFSTCVGIGMYLQSGKVIYLAGPGLATIAYILAGSVMWCSISSLGEMTALFPVRGPIFVFPHRFVDEGVGYAVGWMAWFSWVVIIAAEVLAVAQLFNFHFKEEYLKNIGYPDSSLGWQVGQTTNPGIWVFLFLILVFAINCLPVLWYGRLEYIFGCVKMFFIVGLILFNVVINARQRVPHASGRFWAYDYPFSFRSQNITLRGGLQGHDKVISGSTGTFLAVWTAITTVIFSMIGFESVPITAAECKDLSKNETVKMATRKISLRIVILYTLGTLVVGFNVPYTDPNLRDNAVNSIRGGQNSAFMLAAVRDHIRGWPHFFNAFFIFSATTSGVNSLYLSSRILHALAETADAWPDNYYVEELRVRLNRTTFGVPHAAVFTSWLFGLLAFLATKPYPAVELGRMATNSVVSMLIVYAIICFSYLQFFKW
ncbi:hypothetical protein FGG08_003330 [Glutinoglossum americanum]|uniref:Amino acid permease/ SLC12A domain-containing protein n=1 Tax=Glutinoglossum americanum TaxID=1670608 RepID=A0A9P8I7H8_9PEZI|nr:hypothetical protein FGG08_003330 [Glutinoglossum americanum]